MSPRRSRRGCRRLPQRRRSRCRLPQASRRGASSRLAERSVPVRTCVGCGRKAPQDELLRFVARDGMLVFGPPDPGRGAYTCRRLACFERAASRNAFSRTLRRTVRVDPELVRLYTDH